MAGSSIELSPTLEESSETLGTLGKSVLTPISGIAFWAAVALPFLHLPLLLATGLSSPSTTTAFLTLLALNVVALLVGHPYDRDRE